MQNNAGLRRICKRSDQPEIERLENNDARLILRRHDRVQTESQELQPWIAVFSHVLRMHVIRVNLLHP